MGYLILTGLLLLIGLCITHIPKWSCFRNNRQWWFAYFVSSIAVSNFTLLIVWLTYLADRIPRNKSLLVLGLPTLAFTIFSVICWRRFGSRIALKGDDNGQ